jgi:hypothetical protein
LKTEYLNSKKKPRIIEINEKHCKATERVRKNKLARSSEEGRTVNALALEADEGRD